MLHLCCAWRPSCPLFFSLSHFAHFDSLCPGTCMICVGVGLWFHPPPSVSRLLILIVSAVFPSALCLFSPPNHHQPPPLRTFCVRQRRFVFCQSSVRKKDAYGCCAVEPLVGASRGHGRGQPSHAKPHIYMFISPPPHTHPKEYTAFPDRAVGGCKCPKS